MADAISQTAEFWLPGSVPFRAALPRRNHFESWGVRARLLNPARLPPHRPRASGQGNGPLRGVVGRQRAKGARLLQTGAIIRLRASGPGIRLAKIRLRASGPGIPHLGRLADISKWAVQRALAELRRKAIRL